MREGGRALDKLTYNYVTRVCILTHTVLVSDLVYFCEELHNFTLNDIRVISIKPKVINVNEIGGGGGGSRMRTWVPKRLPVAIEE